MRLFVFAFLYTSSIIWVACTAMGGIEKIFQKDGMIQSGNGLHRAWCSLCCWDFGEWKYWRCYWNEMTTNIGKFSGFVGDLSSVEVLDEQ